MKGLSDFATTNPMQILDPAEKHVMECIVHTKASLDHKQYLDRYHMTLIRSAPKIFFMHQENDDILLHPQSSMSTQLGPPVLRSFSGMHS